MALTEFKSTEMEDLLGSTYLAINKNISSTTHITGPSTPSTPNIPNSTTLFGNLLSREIEVIPRIFWY